MRRLALTLLAALVPATALAQSQNRSQLESAVTSAIIDNSQQLVTPKAARNTLLSILNNVPVLNDTNPFTGPVSFGVAPTFGDPAGTRANLQVIRNGAIAGHAIVAGSDPTQGVDGTLIPVKIYTGVVAPGSANDQSQGYAVGSIGVDTNLRKTYIATDVTPSAAVWALVNGAPPFASTIAPGAGDDQTRGYVIGSIGVNTTTGDIYIARSVATANAVWRLASGGLAPYVGSTPPTVNSDSGSNYAPGNGGVNTATGASYTNKSAAVGAAVWTMPGPPPNYVAGRFYLARGHENLVVASPVAATTMYLTAFFVQETITVSDLGSKINTAGSSNFRESIYAANTATNLPTSTPLATTPDILDTGTGAKLGTLGANVRLNPGMYYDAIQVNDAAAAFVAPNSGLMAAYIGNASFATLVTGGAGTNQLNCLSTPFVTYGTWPDLTSVTFTYLSNGGSCGILLFKVASVP